MKKENQRDKFFQLCGENDKKILLGEEKMNFVDFERLFYLAEYFGFEDYSLEFWNEYSDRFEEELSTVVDVVRLDEAQILEEEAKKVRWRKEFLDEQIK